MSAQRQRPRVHDLNRLSLASAYLASASLCTDLQRTTPEKTLMKPHECLMNVINPPTLEGRTAALGFATAAQPLFWI